MLILLQLLSSDDDDVCVGFDNDNTVFIDSGLLINLFELLLLLSFFSSSFTICFESISFVSSILLSSLL